MFLWLPTSIQEKLFSKFKVHIILNNFLVSIRSVISNETWVTGLGTVSSLLVIAAISIDGFWHVNVGRDSLFIPPHLLLYSSLTTLFVILYGSRQSIPKITWFLASAIIISGPFDELWHSVFGQEEITDILIVWSPPHLVAEVSILALLLVVLRKVLSSNKVLSFTIQWSAISSLIIFILVPLDILGPYRILGEYGGLINIIALATLIYSYLVFQKNRHLLPLFGVMYFLSIPLYIQEGPIDEFKLFHEHLPLTILGVVYVLPAIVVDLFFRNRIILLKTSIFLIFYVAIYVGTHILLIDGYRPLWSILPVYVVFAIPATIIAHFVVTRISGYKVDLNIHDKRS